MDVMKLKAHAQRITRNTNIYKKVLEFQEEESDEQQLKDIITQETGYTNISIENRSSFTVRVEGVSINFEAERGIFSAEIHLLQG